MATASTRRQPVLDPRGDWVGLIEAIYAEAANDGEWAEGISEAARALFPRASQVMTYSLAHGPERGLEGLRFARPESPELFSHFQRVVEAAGEAWLPFHFGSPVLTLTEGLSHLGADLVAEISEVNRKHGIRNSFGVIAHPRPGVVTALTALFEEDIQFTRTERDLLTRIAHHLESGYRLRCAESAVIAEIDAKGEVSTPALAAHLDRVNEARSPTMRRSPEGTALWTALLEGHLSVVPRGERYLVLDNPTSSRRMRALSARESAVLAYAARGATPKQICYALGVSPSHVSSSLQSAAAKVGVLSRTELVRLAALLTRDPRELLEEPALTAAESDVLSLLERGLDNKQIATIRMRSVRTIANQVATLLRKMGATSRRQLVVRSVARGAS